MKYILLIMLAIALSACTGHVGESHTMDIGSEEEFIINMIPHHQEAVDTSRAIAESTDNQKIRDLATRIIDAQTTEITMMNGWVDAWYAQAPTPKYVTMMPDLTIGDGKERDEKYLQGMISHHKMAVEMAQDVLKLNPREEVKVFAQGVIDVQTSEIEEMELLLSQS